MYSTSFEGKKSQRCENVEKEGQETWTETNMQGEGTELGEKSEFKSHKDMRMIPVLNHNTINYSEQ